MTQGHPLSPVTLASFLGLPREGEGLVHTVRACAKYVTQKFGRVQYAHGDSVPQAVLLNGKSFIDVRSAHFMWRRSDALQLVER